MCRYPLNEALNQMWEGPVGNFSVHTNYKPDRQPTDDRRQTDNSRQKQILGVQSVQNKSSSTVGRKNVFEPVALSLFRNSGHTISGQFQFKFRTQ